VRKTDSCLHVSENGKALTAEWHVESAVATMVNMEAALLWDTERAVISWTMKRRVVTEELGRVCGNAVVT
jgi:hypothetical protein